MNLPYSLLPLRDRRFAWYFTGLLVSTAGTSMAGIALTFAVLELTESPSMLGLVLAAQSIPVVVFTLLGGVVADRISRSLVMQVSHVLSGLTQGAVALLLLTGAAEIWMILVLEVFNGIAVAFTFPAMFGVVPLVVPRTHIQQANAMLGFTRHSMRILGPVIGGTLVVTVGAAWAVLIDATTYLLAAACMARVRLPAAADGAQTAGAKTGKPTVLRDLRDGWGAFTSLTWVWVVVVSFGFLNAITAGAWFTVGPVVAKDTIGEAGWGWVLSAEGAGLLLMAVVMMRVRLRYPVRAGIIGVSLMGAPLIVLGVNPELAPLVVLTFVAGAGTEVFSIGWQTAYHEHVPNDVLSRVTSYDALGSFVAIPIGQLTAGPLTAAFGAEQVLVVGGVAYSAIALVTLVSRSVRDLGRAPLDTGDMVTP